MDFPWLAIGALGTAGIAAAAARATRQYAVAAVAGAAFILWLHGWLYFHYTSDDAYISYRYARNFSEGLGLVWNPGEHVEGYSNFLWVMVLAGLDRAGGDIVPGARWGGFALAVAAACGAYALARELLDGEAGRAAGLAASLLLAASGPFALWATAGLEVPLFAVLALGAVLLHASEQRGLRPPLSGAVWALAALARPDAVVLFAVSGVSKLTETATAARGRAGEGARSALLRDAGWLAAWAAGFALIFGPYFAWRYAEYGWFFPNTYYAKVGQGLDQYDRGLRYAVAFVQQYAAWSVLLAPLAIALTEIRRAAAAYVLALLAAWGAYVVYVGGDSLVRFRFLAPLLPLLYPLVAASGAALLASLRLDRPPPRGAVEAAAGVAVAGLLAFTLHASSTDPALVSERRAMDDRVAIGRWLRDNVPEETVIAVIPAGAIPYESRLATVDMLGINDEHIAHRDLPVGSFAAGHEKYDSAYVLDRRPDIIILNDNLEPRPWAAEDYATLNALIPARADMLGNPRLWEEYEASAVEIREGEWFNLLVRKGSAALRPGP